MDVSVVVTHQDKARKRARNRELLLLTERTRKGRLVMGQHINMAVTDAMAEEAVVEDLADGVIMDTEDHLHSVDLKDSI